MSFNSFEFISELTDSLLNAQKKVMREPRINVLMGNNFSLEIE